MKYNLFTVLAAGLLLSLSSCREESASQQSIDVFQSNSSDPIRLSTGQNNNYNSWTLDESTTIVTDNPNDYSSWYFYISDGGGTFAQTYPGDLNNWQGMLNDKYATYPATLRTKVHNDFNEWIYETTSTYYIRTVVEDNFNDFKIYNASDSYICEMKTAAKTDFNKWKFKDFNAMDDPSLCIYMMPVVATVIQYY